MVLVLVINPNAVDPEDMADVEEPHPMQLTCSRSFQLSQVLLRIDPSRTRPGTNPSTATKSRPDMEHELPGSKRRVLGINLSMQHELASIPSN